MSNTAGTTVTPTTIRRHRKGTDVEPADRPELLDVTLRWSDLGLFLACYVAMVAVWVGIGELIVRSDSIQARDQSIAEWFVDSRTATLDTLSALGSNLADTMVKIAVTAVLAIIMRLVWKRWREPLMMVVPLVLEASVFITVTYIVARPRPDVERLESSPVDSSFPSGHVAAAAAYGALIIIVYWHVRNRIARALRHRVERGRSRDRRLGPHVPRHAPSHRRPGGGVARHRVGRRQLVDDPPCDRADPLVVPGDRIGGTSMSTTVAVLLVSVLAGGAARGARPTARDEAPPR